MRKLALVLATLALASCQQAPCECGCPPEVSKRIELRLQEMRKLQPQLSVATNTTTRVIECSPDKPQGCTIQVPVTASRVNGKVTACQVALPYCVVCMRKGKAGAPLPTVTWQLVEGDKPTTEFAFSPNRGINIKHFGMTGKDDFKKLGVSDNGSEFKWQASTGKSDVLDHETEVYAVESETVCTPYDPVIVNTN